jgi:hypothetical protein
MNSHRGLPLVCIAVSLLSLAECVTGPTAISKNDILHKANDENVQVFNRNKKLTPSSTKMVDNRIKVRGSIQKTVSPPSISDMGDAPRHSTPDAINTEDEERRTRSLQRNTTSPTPYPDSGDATIENSTIELEAFNAVPLSNNDTAGQQSEFAELSSTERNIPGHNELRMENQNNGTQLRFDIDVSNVSSFRNNTFYVVDNRDLNCSMINKIRFIFELGRIRHMYVDIICLVIAGIGIVGNLATILIVATNPKLRKPYFLTISTLAIADFTSICFRISAIFLEFDSMKYIECFKPSFYLYVSANIAADNSCILQLVLIAVMKFLLLVCPIKSRAYLRNYHIVFVFFILLSVSTCVTFVAFYLLLQNVKADENISPVLTGFVMVTTIPSILVIIILHIIKIVRLRNSPALQKDLKTMNKVVTIILGIYILYNVQKFFIALKIATAFFMDFNRISALVHHACNPLIYATFSLWSKHRNSDKNQHGPSHDLN